MSKAALLCTNVLQYRLTPKDLIISLQAGKGHSREMKRFLAQSTQHESIQLTTGHSYNSAGLKLQTH